jgi:hypothetical protein
VYVCTLQQCNQCCLPVCSQTFTMDKCSYAASETTSSSNSSSSTSSNSSSSTSISSCCADSVTPVLAAAVAVAMAVAVLVAAAAATACMHRVAASAAKASGTTAVLCSELGLLMPQRCWQANYSCNMYNAAGTRSSSG